MQLNAIHPLPGISLYLDDNINILRNLENECIDIILTDPPYLYLKNQKLDRPFDEALFFSECKRVLKKDGCIVLFGRGTSFYKWNSILNDIGFIFKEELIWDKSYCTSPLMTISRVHETISIHSKGAGKINRVKIPYVEMKKFDLSSIVNDVKRLKATFKNTKSLNAVLEFLENNYLTENDRKSKHDITAKAGITNIDRAVGVMQAVSHGMNEKTIIRTDFEKTKHFSDSITTFGTKAGDGDRCVKIMQAVSHGMNEKTIIKEQRGHYSTIHPTQKPIRLIERLLSLVVPNRDKEDITVLDPFGGSFSTMHAVYSMGMKGISCEIDEEYFQSGLEKLKKLSPLYV